MSIKPHNHKLHKETNHKHKTNKEKDKNKA